MNNTAIIALLLPLALAFISPAVAATHIGLEHNSRLQKLEEKYEIFLARPNSSTAQEIVDQLHHNATDYTAVELKFLEFLCSRDNFDRLLRIIPDGKPEYYALAFRIYILTDAHDTEALAETIGGSIRNHPQSFLLSLEKFNGRLDADSVASIVTSTSKSNVDNPRGMKRELQLRLNAIQSVTVNVESKKKLIDILNKEIRWLQRIIDELHSKRKSPK